VIFTLTGEKSQILLQRLTVIDLLFLTLVLADIPVFETKGEKAAMPTFKNLS
jgi:hypothetical protein